jgi:transposase
MAEKGRTTDRIAKRRRYSQEMKEEAVQLLLEGRPAREVAANLGLPCGGTLYRWKAQVLRQGGRTAVGLEARNRELEEKLRQVERERDILKKALAIFSLRA